MSPPRAFRVLRAGLQCGLLGEGAGPFVTATRSSLPAPQMPGLRFTSLNPQEELRITEELLASGDFDAGSKALAQAGYQLESIPFVEAFGPGAVS